MRPWSEAASNAREHASPAPHVVAGYRLHGGLDERGRYLSPRSRVRPVAVRAWQEQLGRQGHDLIQADPSLFEVGPYPSLEQTRLMLKHGIDHGDEERK